MPINSRLPILTATYNIDNRLKNNRKSRFFSTLILCSALAIGVSACGASSTQTRNITTNQAIPPNGYTPDSDAIDRVLAQSASAARQGANRIGTSALLSSEQAYKRDPENINATLNYAKALRQNDLAQRALIILKPYIASHGDNPDLLTEYAASSLAIGKYQEAENAARKAIVQSPKHYQAYHVLGVSLDAQGFHKQAEVAFRRGLDHWQGDPVPILNNLALSLAAQGYLDESLSILRRAAATAPNRQEIARNLKIISALHANVQNRSENGVAQSRNFQRARAQDPAAYAPTPSSHAPSTPPPAPASKPSRS